MRPPMNPTTDAAGDNSLVSAFQASHYPWSSTAAMIKKILSLIQESRWVRQYLLVEQHRRQDAHILSSLQDTTHSHIQACILDKNEFTQIFLPAYSDGRVGAGVLAEYNANAESFGPCRTARFVIDIKNGTTSIVYNNPYGNRLDMLFMMPGQPQSILGFFSFDRASFLRGAAHDLIDCDIIHQSLLHSCTGVLP